VEQSQGGGIMIPSLEFENNLMHVDRGAPEQEASSQALLLSVALLVVISEAAGEGVRGLEGPEQYLFKPFTSRPASLLSGAGSLIIWLIRQSTPQSIVHVGIAAMHHAVMMMLAKMYADCCTGRTSQTLDMHSLP
jgi:hypothetical protein